MMELKLMAGNESHLEEIGVSSSQLDNWTWSDFEIIAAKLTSQRYEVGGSWTSTLFGRTYHIDSTQGAALCIMAECWLPFVWSHGGDYLDLARVDSLINQQPSLETFEWLEQMFQTGIVSFWPSQIESGLLREFISLAPTSSNVIFRSPPDKRSLAFPADRSQYIPPEQREDVRLQLFPYPKSNKTGLHASLIYTNAVAVNRFSNNPREAAQLASLLLSSNVQEKLSQSTLPVRYDIQRATMHVLPQWLLDEVASTARPHPYPLIGPYFTMEPFQDHFHDFAAGTVSAKEFVDRVHDELDAILDQLRRGDIDMWQERDPELDRVQSGFFKSP